MTRKGTKLIMMVVIEKIQIKLAAAVPAAIKNVRASSRGSGSGEQQIIEQEVEELAIGLGKLESGLERLMEIINLRLDNGVLFSPRYYAFIEMVDQTTITECIWKNILLDIQFRLLREDILKPNYSGLSNLLTALLRVFLFTDDVQLSKELKKYKKRKQICMQYWV
ncbi:hypothetical protein C1645_842305 [Glomus cerebriforme]|uniref:Uncharacterized protein n=1 Tax=Glomus cerebriforme TaxID=658196 RepID=A0A397S905_9GLOM|nr:hypothetical protein C1645_842305 [Glomus cerebriforme]